MVRCGTEPAVIDAALEIRDEEHPSRWAVPNRKDRSLAARGEARTFRTVPAECKKWNATFTRLRYQMGLLHAIQLMRPR